MQENDTEDTDMKDAAAEPLAGPAPEPSYRERRSGELGDDVGGNPFASHRPRPASEPDMGDDGDDGTEPVRDAGETVEAISASGDRDMRPAGPSDTEGLEERMTAARDQGMIQMWLVFGVSVLVAAMSPILLPFLVLSMGARTGIIWFLAIEGFVPVVAAAVSIVELVTRPALRRGGAGRATLAMAVLALAVDVLVIIVFARFGGDVMVYYADAMKGLGNAAGVAW